jgi:hypothetical protein
MNILELALASALLQWRRVRNEVSRIVQWCNVHVRQAQLKPEPVAAAHLLKRTSSDTPRRLQVVRWDTLTLERDFWKPGF